MLKNLLHRPASKERSVRIGMLGLRTLLILEDSKEPVSGADIWEQLEAQSGDRLHSGTVYTTLKRMRERGLIGEALTIHGKPIKAYEITAHGVDVLAHNQDFWKQAPQVAS